MPFKDSKDGQTHYFGDGCNPPHRCPDGTCVKAYNNVCKKCNLPKPLQPEQKNMKEEFESFCQELCNKEPRVSLGERRVRQRIVKFFEAKLKEQKEAMIEKVREIGNPYDIDSSHTFCTGFNYAIVEVLALLKS